MEHFKWVRLANGIVHADPFEAFRNNFSQRDVMQKARRQLASYKDVKFQIDGLPHQDALVKLRKVSGKPEIRLLESPSQANLYIATISVENPSNTESEDLSFELEWQLK